MEVGRKRTRRQWDVYYKQQYDERKQKQKRNGDGAEALQKSDVVHVDDDNDDGVETLNTGAEEFSVASVLKHKNDDDDGVEALEKNDGMDVDDDDDDAAAADVEAVKKSGKEDDDVDIIEFLGASREKQKNDDVDDDDSVEAFKTGEDEDDDDDDDDDGNSIEFLGASIQKHKTDDALNSGEDEDDDVNSIEFLGASIGAGDNALKSGKDEDDDNEAELESGSGDLSEEDGDTRIEADSLVESSRGKSQLEPRIHEDVCVEDSDESVSGSENTNTSEEEDDDDDYKGGESSLSESSDEDDEYGVAETENLLNITALGTHGDSRKREDVKKESDTKQGKDDERSFRLRKRRRRMNMEKEEEELPKINKNRKRDGCVNETHKSQNKETENRKPSSSAAADSSGDCFYTRVKTKGQECSVILGKRMSHSTRDVDLIKILVDSMNAFKDKQYYNIDDKAVAENSLPLRFGFEEEVVLPPQKSEQEEYIDSLFRDLELGLRQTEPETDCTNHYTPQAQSDELKTAVDIDESPAACCRRGNHQAILDEQIGLICKYCYTVIMDIKHVLPPFHQHAPTWERRDKRYYRDEFQSSYFSEIEFGGPASSTPDSTSCTKGTVWDLVPGVEKELYPHQREGFEFMWRNIAGDTIIEKLKQTLADDARGCIISHAPGTGKTRLAIVFLQTFLKLYPACSPMIIAPKGMLLTWEAEFKKWNFNVAFHNLNKKELSGKENAVATELLGQVGSGVLNKDCIRLLKLYSWARGGSILGVSYQLFEKLAGERDGKREQQHENIGEVLLERPGLLVLDEGHTPRNDKSRIWKTLTKVSTQRRIILSGTPFQNSLRELYNTLCVVNPKFAVQDSSVGKPRWKNLANSSDINRGTMLRMRAVLEPYVHVHKGTVLQERLPGLRHTLVFLHPTKSQQTLLESACKEKIMFNMVWMVSLVSIHPSINAVTKRYSTRREETTMDIDAGVKARFLLKLIHFADALGERVLIFGQYIDSLVFIKEQLESIFSWNVGREVLYMDGKLDEKKRQESISCFNDETSEAKVLLASERACSEGINLTGASRVVLLDTVWNPSVEKQAISRAYRLGQKRVVYVYRLFTSGIEVRQYAQQNLKERISRRIFSLGEGHSGKARAVSEDKVLEAMLNLENFNHIFEKIISQPKESDLIKTFGLEEHN